MHRGLLEELALLLDEIDSWTDMREGQLQSLRTLELYTDTELLQLEARSPRYSQYRYPEREKLQRRLIGVEREQRRSEIDHSTHMMELYKALQRALAKVRAISGFE